MTPKELRSIASLLDDPDEAVAVSAMAELLDREEELGDLPGELQDRPDPLLRRRVHQLQAALTLRYRRRNYLARISDPASDLAEKLAALHQLWYDNDSLTQLLDDLHALHRRCDLPENCTLEEIADCMRHESFTSDAESSLRPENFCIGVVLNEKHGSGSVLSLLAAYLSGRNDLEFVNCGRSIMLSDGRKVLLPAPEWPVADRSELQQGSLSVWNAAQVLKYAARMLFSCAVNSDSFRYVYTIGESVSGLPGDEIMDYFPYPFYPDGGDDENDGEKLEK